MGKTLPKTEEARKRRNWIRRQRRKRARDRKKGFLFPFEVC